MTANDVYRRCTLGYSSSNIGTSGKAVPGLAGPDATYVMWSPGGNALGAAGARGGLGYVPLDKAGADLLFGFISQRYERRSLVVTTNLPFARWSEVFLDPTAAAAVIDRIVHHATVLTMIGTQMRGCAGS